MPLTDLLEKAVAEAAKLPAEEQDRFAEWMLAELEDEERWTAAFERSSDALAKLAAKALAEHTAGKTEDLDPDALISRL
jgi:hypothetical protein